MISGIFLTLIAVFGLLMFHFFNKETERFYEDSDDSPERDYGYWNRKYLKTPLFILILLIGLYIVYSDYAHRNNWPTIEFFDRLGY